MLSWLEVQLQNCCLKRQFFSACSTKQLTGKNSKGFVWEVFQSLLWRDRLGIAQHLYVSLLPDGRVTFYLAWPHQIWWLWSTQDRKECWACWLCVSAAGSRTGMASSLLLLAGHKNLPLYTPYTGHFTIRHFGTMHHTMLHGYYRILVPLFQNYSWLFLLPIFPRIFPE